MDNFEAQLSLVMRHMSDAVWIVDKSLQTITANRAAYQLLGLYPDKLNGHHEILPSQVAFNQGSHNLEIYLSRTIRQGYEIRFEPGLTISLPHNREVSIEGGVHPLTTQNEVIGAVAVFRPASSERSQERVQADFVAMASHNLRTPLMAIQAALDYALEAQGEQPKKQQLLREARTQTQNIAVFFQSLLDVVQLTSSRGEPLNITSVELMPLLETTLIEQRGNASSLDFFVQAPSSSLQVSADKAKTVLILQNLIAYANSRSKPGDVLQVIVQETPDEVIISLIDQGPTISPAHYQEIFWSIYPLESGKQNSAMPYSYGIGLFGVRCLVELQGGQIWASAANGNDMTDSPGISLNFTLPIWREGA